MDKDARRVSGFTKFASMYAYDPVTLHAHVHARSTEKRNVRHPGFL